MSRMNLIALLLVGTLFFVTLSFAQPTAQTESSTKLLDVFQPGQTVGLRDFGAGLLVQILSDDEVQQRIEGTRMRREQIEKRIPEGELGQQFRERVQERNNRVTPEEHFARLHPKVKEIHSDHIVLVNGDTERRIAVHAIVEVQTRIAKGDD